MKFNIARETLLKPLQMVVGVVENRHTMPILSHVLLAMQDDQLSVTATDTEIELIGQISLGQSVESQRITIAGRKLFDICRALPDQAAIELYHEKERVILRSGGSRFTLATLPAADFPNLTQHESQLSFSLSQKSLGELLQKTYFAMANQDVRYYLNGALLEARSDKLCAVATDGHRFALHTVMLPTGALHRIQVIIPRKGVLELIRLLDDDEGLVTVFISNTHIRVQAPHFTFTSKLIEGRFPEYERAIPKIGDKSFELDRDLLKFTLARAAILCGEKTRIVRFVVQKNSLQILANNPEQEAAEEQITINYDNEPLDIAFNVSYLQDVLNTVRPGMIKLNFAGPNDSILIEEMDEGEGQSIFVVMPMRL